MDVGTSSVSMGGISLSYWVTNYCAHSLGWVNWDSYSWAELGEGDARSCGGYTFCSSFLNNSTIQLKIFYSQLFPKGVCDRCWQHSVLSSAVVVTLIGWLASSTGPFTRPLFWFLVHQDDQLRHGWHWLSWDPELRLIHQLWQQMSPRYSCINLLLILISKILIYY